MILFNKDIGGIEYMIKENETGKIEKSKKTNRLWIVALVFAVLVAITVIVGIFSGRLAIIIKQPGEKIALSTIACDAEIVSRYNDAMYFQFRDGKTESIDEEGIKNLEKEIRAKDNFDKDATCQTILFFTAVYFKNAEKAQAALDIINNLHGQYVYADSNLRNSQSLFTFQNKVDDLNSDIKGELGD